MAILLFSGCFSAPAGWCQMERCGTQRCSSQSWTWSDYIQASGPGLLLADSVCDVSPVRIVAGWRHGRHVPVKSRSPTQSDKFQHLHLQPISQLRFDCDTTTTRKMGVVSRCQSRRHVTIRGLLTRYSNSIQTPQTFISVIITFVITVQKGSFWLVQIYKIFNFFIVHKRRVCCDAYCHVIGNDAYDVSKKLTSQFFRRSLVVVVS